MLLYIWMKVGSKFPYIELQTKLGFCHGRPTFIWVIALCSKFISRAFLDYAFTLSEWKLVASFHAKSCKSSLTFVAVDLLLHELWLSLVQNSFPGLFFDIFFHISKWKLETNFHMKSYKSSSTFVTADLLFHKFALCSKFFFYIFLGCALAYLNDSL